MFLMHFSASIQMNTKFGRSIISLLSHVTNRCYTYQPLVTSRLRFSSHSFCTFDTISVREYSSSRTHNHGSTTLDNADEPCELREGTDRPEACESATLLNLSDFVSFRSVDDILSVDARSLTSDCRLDCLLELLNIHRRSQPKVSHMQFYTHPKWANECWTHRFIHASQMELLANLELAVNPMIVQGAEPEWFHSDPFKLLLLTTAASAHQLDLPRLLLLAGFLRHIWWYFDPKVYASVIRLVTSRVNEIGFKDIVKLSSLLNHFQTKDAELHTDPEHSLIPSELHADQLNQLRIEIGLLRRALILSVLSRLSHTDEYDAISLLVFANNLTPYLATSEKNQLFEALCLTLKTNRRQLGIHPIAFICSRLSMMNWCSVFILSKIFSKIEYTGRHPDSLPFIAAGLAALANLHVGSPHMLGEDKNRLGLIACPPLMPGGITPPGIGVQIFYPGVDLRNQMNARWIDEAFSVIAGLVQTHVKSSQSESDMELLHEVAYSLSLLGYRAVSMIDTIQNFQPQQPECASSEVCRPPYAELIDLLNGPLPETQCSVELQHIGWLPRIEWQVYYKIAHELYSNSGDVCHASLIDYKSIKHTNVLNTVNLLRERVRASIQLNMYTFCRFKTSEDGFPYFGDIVFVADSSRSRNTSKVAVCFVCAGRDFLVSRPLKTLLSAYENTSPEIPVVTFDLSAVSDRAPPVEVIDRFLRNLCELMYDAPAVETSALSILSAEHSF